LIFSLKASWLQMSPMFRIVFAFHVHFRFRCVFFYFYTCHAEMKRCIGGRAPGSRAHALPHE
jgi:hypothetical protein